MPASDDRYRATRPRATGVPAVERVEGRLLCAAGTPAPFVPYAGESALLQLTISAGIGRAGDEDFFSIGRLRAGDVLSAAQAAAGSARGTLADGAVELYRAGGNPANPVFLAFNDDGGSANDPMISRQALDHDDEYFVKAKAGYPTWTGSYALALWLETRTPPGPPPGVTTLTEESEPNDQLGVANDVAASWRNVSHVSSGQGVSEATAAAATAEFAFELWPGDVVTVSVDSDSDLDAAVWLLGEGGTDVLATDAGDGRRPGDWRDAAILAYRAPQRGVYRVRVAGNGQTAGDFRLDVYLSRGDPAVAGRYVFYNNTRLDGWSAAAGPSDDAAVAHDKTALTPGRPATPSNFTNFTGGINGVMLDLINMPDGPREEDLAFEMSTPAPTAGWVDAPPPTVLSRRVGAGTGGSDRITLTWPDGAIVNRWLRVTLKASPANGLAADDVVLFGNLVGETADDPTASAATVTPADVIRVRAASGTVAAVASWFDFNRDGRVNAIDQAAARANASRSLDFPAAVPPAPAAGLRAIPPVPRPGISTSRRLLYESDDDALA